MHPPLDGTGAKVSVRRGLGVVVLALFGAVGLAGCSVNLGDSSAALAPGPTPPARQGAYVWVCGAPDLVVGSADGGATWQVRHRRPDGDIMTGDLWAIAFGDVSHGWVVRRGIGSPTATLLATADAGKTWTWQQTAPKDGRLLAVAATDASHVWAVGYQFAKGPGPSGRSLVIASTDGGATWKRQRLPASAAPFHVAFADARHGWILDGWRNRIFTTSDGGAHWRASYSAPRGVFLRGLAASGTDRCWAVGYREHPQSGFVARTSDAGQHWSAQDGVSSEQLQGVSFPDSNHGWAVGASGTAVTTSDGGATWTAQDTGGDYGLVQVSFSDPEHGWALIFPRGLLATVDGGKSWSVVVPSDAEGVLTGLTTVQSEPLASQ
jgi:photosystem II stability/assembly factor-like uncharacterized protein